MLMQMTNFARNAIAKYAVSTAAIGVVATSIFLAGVWRHSGAKDIDARYFYVAAQCWTTAQSPYVLQVFVAKYIATFGHAPSSVFSGYPPTLLLLVAPMALFPWPLAAKFFSILNFAAAMVLFWACYRLVREELGGPLRPVHWFWIVVAATLSGVAGTIFTGQTSVFITAAVAIAFVGCRCKYTWLTGLGLIVATAKPQLAAPLFILIPLLEPAQRRITWIAAGVVATVCAYAAAVDPHFVQSYLGSLARYNALKENDPTNEFGWVPLLVRFGIPHQAGQILGVVATIVILVAIVWYVRSSGRRLSENALALSLAVFSVGLLLPLHGYDTCCYATGVALMGTMQRRFQAFLVLPVLLLWRPALVHKLTLNESSSTLVTILVWLSILVAMASITAVRLRSNPLRVRP